MADQQTINDNAAAELSPPPAKPTKAVKVTPADPAVALVQAYLDNNQVSDFSAVPFHAKLAVLQNTPSRYVLSRTIAGNQIPYVSHQYAEKALNFAFNFRVSSEILNHSLETKVQKVTVRDVNGNSTQEDRITHIGAVHMKFTFTLPDGGTIVRTVVSSHKAFSNPATTPDDALKSAVSKSWTVVARSFGIGTDVNEVEDDGDTEPEAPKGRTASATGKGVCGQCGAETDAAWKKQCVPCYKKANPRS